MAPVSLVYCAACGPEYRRVANACGWLNGARLPGTVYTPPDLYFADQDWRAPDRAAYIDALARHRPAVATVLDWERPDQLPEVLGWSEEAAALVTEAVVIVPKVPGLLGELPDAIGGRRVVLGYSVPTSYGGTDVPLWEFGRRPVHLLGGSPHAQLRLSCYLNVVSADGNMSAQQSRRGRFWCPRLSPLHSSRWWQLSEAGDTRNEGAHLECFRRSLINVRAAWAALN